MYRLPIFPLPGLVLFPRTLLPLHIFEPRYAAMFKAVIAGDQRVAVGQLRAGRGDEPPRIHRVATPARVVFSKSLYGNRYDVVVEGIERAEVVSEDPPALYRTVVLRPLCDVLAESDRPRVQERLRELLGLCAELASLMPECSRQLSNLESTHLHPAIIADVVASTVVRDPYARQGILEELDVARRLGLVSVQVRQLCESRTAPPAPAAIPRRRADGKG